MASRVPQTVVAVVALLAGIVCLALWRLVAGTEAQPFAPGAQAPRSVDVTSGQTYAIAVPGGMSALLDADVPVTTAHDGSQSPDLECTWSVGAGGAQSLKTTAESTSTKAVDVVGSFVAPVTGRITVDCQHWGTVFVPDADNAPGDPSGWFLVASTVLLLVGGTAGMSSGWSVISRYVPA